VSLEFESTEDIEAQIDPGQIEDAVLNLLVNAIEAVGSNGHVNVRVFRSRKADVSDADEAVIEVSDDGPGISEEDLTKVFSPFFTKRLGGTGLGLPAVRRIARLHSGRVEVRSTIGQGSVFTLHLPISQSSR
jgi:two-component system, NtrC family, sensor histidine kinase HydH